MQKAGGKQSIKAKRVEKSNALEEEKGMKQYKVLTQKDKWFSSKFDPAALETALNAYAEQGWRVVASTSGDFPGAFGSRNEIVVILERDA